MCLKTSVVFLPTITQRPMPQGVLACDLRSKKEINYFSVSSFPFYDLYYPFSRVMKRFPIGFSDLLEQACFPSSTTLTRWIQSLNNLFYSRNLSNLVAQACKTREAHWNQAPLQQLPLQRCHFVLPKELPGFSCCLCSLSFVLILLICQWSEWAHYWLWCSISLELLFLFYRLS